ncbi:PREDICTED: uncharacterized protein LOC104738576 [Camelina sativa]|uniref:Uncharacterized protein LOC104738576 n=1 Tax=Camelina sativa TaxID=90675 RepID=A0ABM1QUJ2_CAMSA|nr:PREDICTED: uncharacterized protein LOC104738576 [Camelina sativa]
MGRGMSMTKLSFFQVNSKCMAEMKEKQVSLQRKVDDLQAVIEHLKRGEPEVGENSAARSVTNRAHPKCLLLDYNGTGEIVAEALVMSSDPQDFVNGIPLGPNSYKVLVENAIKPDAFLCRPTTNILNMEQAVGEMLAWPDDNCIFHEDNAPKSPNTASANKCILLNWRGNEEVVVAEGRWQSKELDALVNGLPIGPNVVKVFVDVVLKPETFLWKPTTKISIIKDCLKTFVAWPEDKVVMV